MRETGEVAYLFDFRSFRDVTNASLTWLSQNRIVEDLPEVSFAIEPTDEFYEDEDEIDYGDQQASSTFRVDNDQSHSIELNTILTEQSNEVTLSYLIDDSSADTLDLLFEYSEDGNNWTAMSDVALTGRTNNIGPDDYSGSIIWSSQIDRDNYEAQIFTRVRVTDGWDGYTDSSSISFDLDNNDPPMVTEFQSPLQYEEAHDTVRISIIVSDETADTVNLKYYSSILLTEGGSISINSIIKLRIRSNTLRLAIQIRKCFSNLQSEICCELMLGMVTMITILLSLRSPTPSC